MGDNALPAVTGDTTAIVVVKNNTVVTNGPGSANYGIYIEVSGNTSLNGKNIGIISNSTCWAPSFINNKAYYQFVSGSHSIELGKYTYFLFNTSSSYSIAFPDKFSIATQFGYSDSSSLPYDFAVAFWLHMKYNASGTLTFGGGTGYNLYNQNGDIATFAMAAGDSACILCTNEGGTFRYEMLSRYSQ